MRTADYQNLIRKMPQNWKAKQKLRASERAVPCHFQKALDFWFWTFYLKWFLAQWLAIVLHLH